MQMILNLNLFPSEKMDDSKQANNKFNHIHKHIERLHNETVNGDKFDKMIHRSIFSVSTLSIVLGTIFGMSDSALFLFCWWYCNTLQQIH
jgi:hypothetical protein